MPSVPETRYAKSGDVSIAYQVVGDGPIDLVLVPGDVNSTMAAALVAAKLHVPIAHLEAGLRSFDRTMPEEINRIVTDQLSEMLFTHSPEAHDNLIREGIAAGKIHLVGNTMIDTLVRLMPLAEKRWPTLRTEFGNEGKL